MANYYVSFNRGNDSTGTGTATNPWKTISKAIAGTPAITLSGTGDTLYVEPGVYRELITLALSPTSGGPLTIIGDGDGAGFAAGGYTTPATGVVEIRGWTDDVTPMTTGDVLSASGKSYVNLKKIKMISGNGTGIGCFLLSGTHSNWTFEDCIFVASSTRTGLGRVDATAGAALNHTFNRCDFVGVSQTTTFFGLQIRTPLNATEYNVNVLVQNCNFFSTPGAFQVVQNGGSGSGWGTGITVQQCGFWWCVRGVHVNSSPALTTPIGVYGNAFNCCTNAIIVTTSGQVVEDGNVFGASFANLTNVTAGTHSIQAACPAFNVHDERIFGGNPRPFGEPSAVSPYLAAGNYGTPPTVDIWNRGRPEGGASLSPSTGSIERHDTAFSQSSVVQAGSVALQITGPGSEEWWVPVAATSTTLTIYTYVDSNYSTTTPPVFEVDAEPQIGVSAASSSATSTTGQWNQITIPAFTPTSAGWVKVRVRAVPAAANGICYIDSFGGATGDPANLGLVFRGSAPKFAASTTTTTIVNVFNSEC